MNKQNKLNDIASKNINNITAEDKNYIVNNYQEYFMNLSPDFAKIVEETKKDYEEGGYHYIEHSFFNDFTDYVIDLVEARQFDIIPNVMNIAEILMEHGSDDIQNAVATCFLENLSNISLSRPEEVPFEIFVPHLGPKSIEYCKAWDEFMGTKTPGLW